LGAFAFVIVGCQKPQQPRTPIARIDSQTLTLEEIEARFDSSRGISQAQVHEYVQRWLTDELLYQEAVRRGLDQTEDLDRRLEDIRRQLAINALLEQEIFNVSTEESAKEELRSYYEENRSEFLLAQDVALVSFVFFRERDAANAFRTKVLRGTSWSEAINQLSADPQLASSVVMRADSSYYTAATLLPSELWRVVASGTRQEPSFPVRTDEGYCITIVWKYTRRGETAELDYVRDEIRSRLAINRRQHTMDKLLENLRSKHVVQIFISSVPQDTLSLRGLE
jgi:hypothetical protein